MTTDANDELLAELEACRAPDEIADLEAAAKRIAAGMEALLDAYQKLQRASLRIVAYTTSTYEALEHKPARIAIDKAASAAHELADVADAADLDRLPKAVEACHKAMGMLEGN